MHVDDDTLALLAMGESEPEAEAHVRTCEVCRGEVASLSTVAELLVAAGRTPTAPAPSHLWAGIEESLDPTAPAQGGPTPTPQPGQDELAGRRFRPAALLLAAAAGAVVALAGSALLGTGDRYADPVTRDVTVASAELAALTDAVAPASAEIIERDGDRVLQVDAGDLPAVDGDYLEVWLLTSDASGMVTVGLLETAEQEFVLPEDLSTDTFAVVDVSVEHYDGDPTHSGQSLWRGPLAGS